VDNWEAAVVKGYQPSKLSPRQLVQRTVVFAIVLAVLGATVIGLVWLHDRTGGDPGGQVMNQLTPVVTALPGYGTAALPWVGEPPSSLNAPYIVKMEPHQDSCDGRPGTQGWSQVVVQARFGWSHGQPALIAYMKPRLAKLGWSANLPPPGSSSSGFGATKTLKNGTNAELSVTPEGGIWQLDAMGQPAGTAASGC